MAVRQRRIFSLFGVVIFVLGGALGVWTIISKQEEVIVGSMAWSPDGQRLVFAWNHALYTMNVDRTRLHQLSSMNGDYLESAWSPSGDRIIYMFRRNRSAKYALWFIDATGQNAEPALHEEPLDEFYPHWSPNGKWLGLYRTSVYEGSPSEYGYGRFILTDFTNVYEQPDGLSITDDMEWSPDSKEVAFMGFNGDNWNIYSVTSDGTYLQQLTDSNYDRSPAWSPDGNQLAFYSERDTQQNWRGSIYVLDLPSQNIQRITGVVKRTDRIEWSPDGRRIALATYDYSSDQIDLFLMNANGSNFQKVATDIEGQISWSPDGRFLAFAASKSLVVLDANTNKIILRYHPVLGLSSLPISIAKWISLGLLLLGPLFAIPSTLVHFTDIHHPVYRCFRAVLHAYAVFGGGSCIIGLVVLAGFLIILFFALSML